MIVISKQHIWSSFKPVVEGFCQNFDIFRTSNVHENIGHRSSVPRLKYHDDNKLCRTDKASFDLTKPFL